MITTILTDSEKESWEYTEEENLEARDNEVSGVNIPMSFLEQERVDVIAMGIERCLKDFKLDIKVRGSVIKYGGVPHMTLDFAKKKEK